MSAQQQNLLNACAAGDIDFLQKFVQKNRQKKRYALFDNHKWGPLHHAVASNSIDCVRLLLSLELLDTRLKSHEGQTCLFVAIDRGISCEIIKMLLKHTPELFNLPNNENVYPIHAAVLRRSLEIVKTMIETLNEIEFPIQDQFDWDDENSLFLAVRKKDLQMVDYLMENMKFDFKRTNETGLNAAAVALLPDERGENESITVRILQKLIPLCYDLNATDLMQNLILPITFSSLFDQLAFDWFMEKWYLNERNTHSQLVQHSLEALKNVDFEYKRIIIGLHSEISHFLVKENDQNKNDILYRNILKDFSDLFKFDRDLFAEIARVMQPKLDVENISYAIMKFMPTTDIDEAEFGTQFVEMFDIMNIADIIDIKKLLFFTPSPTYLNNMFLLLMPFSIEATADVYVIESIKDISTRANEVKQRLEENTGLARFCVNGHFRINNSLKSLCRAVIRTKILQSNGAREPHSQQLTRIRSMDLPNKIKNFLLFNYTKHELK